MARRAKRRRDHLTSITNPFSDPIAAWLPPPLPSVRSSLSEVEDRRTWSPEPILEAPPRSSRGVSQIRAAQPSRKKGRHPVSAFRVSMTPRAHLAFKAPAHVAICVRRKQRREVLLALGKGGGGKRRPRRNGYSNVRC